MALIFSDQLPLNEVVLFAVVVELVHLDGSQLLKPEELMGSDVTFLNQQTKHKFTVYANELL